MFFSWKKYLNRLELARKEDISETPCVPYGFKIEKNEFNSYQVTWRTKASCLSYLNLYEKNDLEFNSAYKVIPKEGDTPQQNHTITLLNQDTIKYSYLLVVSNGEEYGVNGDAIQIPKEVQ